MNGNGSLRAGRRATIGEYARNIFGRLSPRQRQYLLLGAIVTSGFGLLWLMFALQEQSADPATAAPARPSGVTNIGIMPPGQQVNPLDQWVGTAGKKLAQYESDREEQHRLNRERREFEQRTMQRFADLEKKLTAAPTAATTIPASPPQMAGEPDAAPRAATEAGLPPLPPEAMPFDLATLPVPVAPPPPVIVRVSLAPRTDASAANTLAAQDKPAAEERTVSTYLPVSFTRGQLLGGLDAPTGGQAQGNPHPVLIRLADNSVLPNHVRGEYRDCFVIAAGYGDISSERAYLRTENLSCVRHDGATLEVRIQGSIYGEDGKVGLRGRLVTKQGQMLANALLAGVVGGIGQGLSTASSDYSTSALGTVSTASGADAYRAGVGAGVGRALDRLAQYYIRLAENTFPVIEIDAGREIDVVITKGVRIDTPIPAPSDLRGSASPARRYLESSHDIDY
ncbi:MAG: TraB/VirB10 family protein [Azoarcus sp.]|jgi:conjugal transfer pilus assembly protein TraB|nr:TraB/VirB10 family protein [Azoarcus sp.]